MTIANSDFSVQLEEKVERAKKNARWRKQYMTWQQTIDEERFEAREEGRREGRLAGIAEGAHDKAVETARRFLQMGLPAEQVAQGVDLSIDEVRTL
ncbi:MAG: hypothetical protein IJP62_05325 [Treponema sp.]|nr:hypothetical protein [Treponema sp.]